MTTRLTASTLDIELPRFPIINTLYISCRGPVSVFKSFVVAAVYSVLFQLPRDFQLVP